MLKWHLVGGAADGQHVGFASLAKIVTIHPGGKTTCVGSRFQLSGINDLFSSLREHGGWSRYTTSGIVGNRAVDRRNAE